MRGPQIFLSPGPTTVPVRVAHAEGRPMVSHRSSDFSAVFRQMTEGVQAVFRTKNDLLTLTASGTGGMEAVAANLFSAGDQVLVASVGNFGDRFRKILESFGIVVEYMEFPWGQAVDPAAIRARLEQDTEHRLKAVVLQHNETSTGVANPIAAVSAARGDHPAILVVDSISGMAAVPLETDLWNVDVVIAASQKAFMSPPGLCFVSLNERAWQLYERSTLPKYYFDFGLAKKNLAKYQTPHTPAVSLVYAVAEATAMIAEEGLDAVLAAHALRRDIVRAGVEAIGLRPLVQNVEYASPAVSCIVAPEGIAPDAIRKIMKEKYNVHIASGMGKLKDSTFRIPHLGYMNNMDLLSALAALEMALAELGYAFPLGAGVAAAQRVMMARC